MTPKQVVFASIGGVLLLTIISLLGYDTWAVRQLQLSPDATLAQLYPNITVFGSATCSPYFQRLTNGLVGSAGCNDLAVGGAGAGSTLSTFALAPINSGNTSGNSSCIPRSIVLPGGQVYILPGPCSPPVLPPTGIGAGFVCSSLDEVMVNANVTADGRLVEVLCSPVNQTSLNGSAVQGDLTGVWPYLFLKPQPDITAGCSDIGIYTLCLSVGGLVTLLNPNGASIVYVTSSVFSSTGTITGQYGVSLDLTNTSVTPGSYGTGNQLPTFTVNSYGRLTAAGSGNTVVLVGQAITSSTITGNYGSTVNLIPTAVTPGPYGGPGQLVSFTADQYGRLTAAATGATVLVNGSIISSSSLYGNWGGEIEIRPTTVTPNTYGSPFVPSFTVEADGRLTFAANGVTPVVVNSTINSNTGSITGLYGNTVDLVTQAGLVAGVYGNSTSCLSQLTINAQGVITAAACLSVSGLGGNGSGFSVFLGTANEVIVTQVNNITLQFSTPQPIATTSSVTFAGVTVTGATADGVAVFGASSQLTSVVLLSGEIVIGSTGAPPVAGFITGAANQIVVTPGAGSILLSLAGNLSINTLQLLGLADPGALIINGSGDVGSVVLSNGQMLLGVNGSTPVAATITGTLNEINVVVGAGSVTLSTPQPIATTSNVQFNALTLGGGTASSVVYLDASKNLASVALTNGQFLIGANGANPLVGTITGTANEIIVTLGAGTITLSAPQAFCPTCNVTFNNVAITDLNANATVFTDVHNNLVSLPLGNGQLLIGSANNMPVVGAIAGTPNEVIVTLGAGTITLSTPQPIGTGSSPTFAGLSISTFSGAFLVGTSGTSLIETSIPIANVIQTTTTLGGALSGTLPNPSLVTQSGVYPGSYGGNISCIPLITVSAGGVITNVGCFSIAGTFEPIATNSTFIGTPNQIIITQVSNSTLVFSTPQDIGLASTPQFATVKFGSLTADGAVYLNGAQQLTSVALTNGQILIGDSGTTPVAATITPTANQVLVANGPGTITLSLPQSIAITSQVIFGTVSDTAECIGTLVYSVTASQSGTTVTGTGFNSSMAPGVICWSGTVCSFITTCGSSTTCTTTNTLTQGSAAASLCYGGIEMAQGNIAFAGSAIYTGLTPSEVVVTSSAGALITQALSNGQILIGNGGSFTAATITPGASVTVANGGGTITLNTIQPITTGSSPSFTGLFLTGTTIDGFLYVGASNALVSTAAPTNGQLLVGVTSGVPVLGSIAGTANQVIVTVGVTPGVITLSLPQSINTAASVTFGSMTLGGLTQNMVVITGAGGLLSTAGTMSNGQIVIGVNSGAPVVGSIASAGGTITVTPSAGGIDLAVVTGSVVSPTTITGTAHQIAITSISGGVNVGLTDPTVMTDATVGSTSYSTGTCSTSGSSTTVTGSGTTWLNTMTGGLLVSGASVAGINYVASTTSIVLESAVTIAGGSTCTIYYAGSQFSSKLQTLTGPVYAGVATSTGTVQGPATVNVFGPTNSATGINIYSTDEFPSIQFNSGGHGTNTIFFDGYSTSIGTFLRSAATRPWAIAQGSNLVFEVGTTGSAGGATTYSSLMVITPTTVQLSYTTAKSAIYLDANNAFQSMTLTNGQIMVGSSGNIPVAGAITSTGGTITVSVGAGTINLEVATGSSISPTNVNAACSISAGSTTYTTGTVSQAVAIATGSGTTFTAAMVGGTIVYATGACAYILDFVDTTHLIVTPAQTVASGAFTIYSVGVQSAKGYLGVTNALAGSGTASLGGTFTYYAAGTASQSGNTITGSSTTWVAGHTGCVINWASGSANFINNFVSATSLVGAHSQTVASGSYVLTCGAVETYQVHPRGPSSAHRCQGNLNMDGQFILGVPAYQARGINNFAIWSSPGGTGSATIGLMEWMDTTNSGGNTGYPLTQLGDYMQQAEAGTLQFLINHNMYIDAAGTYRNSATADAPMQSNYGNGFIQFSSGGIANTPGTTIASLTHVMTIVGSSADFTDTNKVLLNQEAVNGAVFVDANLGLTSVQLGAAQVLMGPVSGAGNPLQVSTLLGTANQIVLTESSTTLTWALANPTVMPAIAIGSTALTASTFRTVGTSTAVDSSSANLVVGMAGGIFTCGATVVSIAYVVNTTSMVLETAIPLSAGTSCTIEYAGHQATSTLQAFNGPVYIGTPGILGVLNNAGPLSILSSTATNLGLQVYTNDLSPAIQLMTFGHDNNQLLFDVYQTGASTFCSGTTAAWVVQKTSGVMNFLTGTCSSAGAVPTLGTPVQIQSTGINFQNSGLSGAAPTVLSYHELTSGSFTFTGPCASPPSVTVEIERTGSTVTLRVPFFQCTVSSGTIFTSSTNLATRFIPAVDICWLVTVFNANVAATGSFLVNTAGTMAVYPGLGCTGTFGSNQGGLNSQASGTAMSTSFTYLVV